MERADSKTKQEIEHLVAGDTLKKISLRLVGDSRYVELAIPNREVQYIYNNTIMYWFRDHIRIGLYKSLTEGEAEEFKKGLSTLSMKSISNMDGHEVSGFYLGESMMVEELKKYCYLKIKVRG